MKTCFKCHRTLPMQDFYKHKDMGDGHLNKCKECTKADVKKHYRDTIEDRRLYEQQRGKTAKRKAAQRKYAARRKTTQPEKLAARRAVQYAIHDGTLRPRPCEVCGNPRAEAHHDDYKKMLTVRWLCKLHHMQAHGRSAF